MTTGVINSPTRADAIASAKQFLSYYPFRYAAIVTMSCGVGWTNGKTLARINRLARTGYKVELLTKGAV